MNWEQPVYSFSDRGGEPPTPTKTPTSATFLQTSFETPKQESSFYDPRVTWNTADPCATSPDFLKTPNYLAFATPKGSPVVGESNRKRRFSGQNIEDEIASHVHHLSPNPGLKLPPVEPSRQLSSSPNPSLSSSSTKQSGPPTSKAALISLKLGLEENNGCTMRSAGSMQTPPPTSTSASRRKSQKAQAAKLAKQSYASARRMSTPVVPKSNAVDVTSGQTEESPVQLGALQFSPDGIEFPLSGPATAPIYPQQKLFWDPDQNTDGMNIDFSAEDPFTLSFGLGTPKGLDPFVSLGEQTTADQLPASASFNHFDPRSSQITDAAMSIDLDSTNQSDFLTSSGLMIRGTSTTKFPGKGVNPSLLFSSPGRFPAQSASAKVHPNDTLQPYAHQIGDAQIENEVSSNKRPKKRRKPETDSPAVMAALETLRDENDLRSEVNEKATDRATFLLRKSSQKSRASIQSSELLKRSAQAGHSGLHRLGVTRQPKKRPVVTLTIDAHGRAKTETKTACDDDEPSSNARMELDSPSDDSEKSSSSGSTMMILSRPQSFALPYKKHQNPKLARFATDSKTHSQKSSYASMISSGKNANILPVWEKQNLRRATGLAPSVDGQRRPHSKNMTNRSSSAATVSELMNNMRDHDRETEIESETDTVITSDDDKGDAQYELKKIIQNRAHDRAAFRSGLKNGKIGEARDHDSCTDQMTPCGYSALLPAHDGRARNHYDSISPTTITDPDLTTPSTGPSTGRESHVSDSTRCRLVQEMAPRSMCRPESEQTPPDIFMCLLHRPDAKCERGPSARAVESSLSGAFQFTARTQVTSIPIDGVSPNIVALI
ncbi:hypothetical protein MMC07_004540 [Pseudocyphellaria aurata]|nr:hypothetical protein [Pseudocyphellaria aurata]